MKGYPNLSITALQIFVVGANFSSAFVSRAPLDHVFVAAAISRYAKTGSRVDTLAVVQKRIAELRREQLTILGIDIMDFARTHQHSTSKSDSTPTVNPTIHSRIFRGTNVNRLAARSHYTTRAMLQSAASMCRAQRVDTDRGDDTRDW